jgi:enamine deaminase RidA (YjgF/YER057c/UK114 family)
LVDGETEHLKSTPKFERAKVLISNKQCTIFVSGTAAIRNEKSSHIDNVSLQTIETIANINYLISSGNLKNNGWQVKSEAKLTSIRVYVKNKNDFEIVKLEVEKAWPAIQSIYLEAEVCRPELLVEIEGIAEIQI